MSAEPIPVAIDSKLIKRIEKKAMSENINILFLIHAYLNYALIHHQDVLRFEESLRQAKEGLIEKV